LGAHADCGPYHGGSPHHDVRDRFYLVVDVLKDIGRVRSIFRLGINAAPKGREPRLLPKAFTGAYKYFLRQTSLIETGDDPDRYASADQEAAPATKSAAIKKGGPPRTLAERLAAFDAQLVAAALAQPREATEHVTKAVRVAQFPQDLNTWNEAQVRFAITTSKGFEAMRRKAQTKA
jgi:hypothetical protein